MGFHRYVNFLKTEPQLRTNAHFNQKFFLFYTFNHSYIHNKKLTSFKNFLYFTNFQNKLQGLL